MKAGTISILYSSTRQLSTDWITKSGLSPYISTLQEMEDTVQQIALGQKPQTVWLLEHPSLYTLGSSAQRSDIIDLSVPTYDCGRGGQVTYHGPGQRIIYTMLDLKNYGQDLRAFVYQLEKWIIETLKIIGLQGFTRPDRVGIWVTDLHGNESKIAAIGLRVRKWITFHGIALNVCPDLRYYQGIIPCGIRDYGVTSLEALNILMPMNEIDKILQKTFKQFF